MSGKLRLFIVIAACVCCVSSGRAQDRDPYEIYQRHYEALGGLDKIKAQKTSHVTASIELVGTGLAGTVEVWSQSPLRNRTNVDLTVITQITGDNGEHAWSIDTNGKVKILRDSVTVRERRLQKLIAEYEHLDRASKTVFLAYRGIEAVDGAPCFVVEMTNAINDDTAATYFDTTTFLALKTIAVSHDGQSHSLHKDYREVNGVLTPFRDETTEYPTEMRQIIQMELIETNVEIDPALFEPPGTDVKDFSFLNGRSAEDIPFQFIENHIYLPLEIGGKTRLWILDSGAGATVILKKFADELGLKSEGNLKAQGVGNLVDYSFATIPPFSLPGLSFDEQRAAVMDLSSIIDKILGLDVAGILGYDFLSRLVIKVDFANELISFYHPDEFTYRGLGTVIDAPISQDNMFHIPITVDGEYGGLWNLDLGAGGMAFHYPFAESHGLLERKGISSLGFGAGGANEEKDDLFHTFEMAGHTVTDLPVSIPVAAGKGAFSDRLLTGNAGNTLFRNFILYLDYKRGQVIVEKGDDFGTPYRRDNSGLQVFYNDDKEMAVMHVAEGTPAAKAGFRADDVLLSINNISTAYFDGIIAVRKLFREPPGTEYKIAVTRDGERRELKLKLKDLYK